MSSITCSLAKRMRNCQNDFLNHQVNTGKSLDPRYEKTLKLSAYGNSCCGAVAEWLMYRSHEKKVPSLIPRLGISVEVTS